MHRRGRRRAIAAQDRRHDAVMLGIGFGKTAEIAELRAAEWLHAHARRDRHFREIIVMRAGIDDAVEGFVGLMMALRIADMNERSQLLMRRFKCAALGGQHALGGKARA